MARIKYYDSVTQQWVYGDMAVCLPPSRLPAEYQEVEYIGSTGTQYIDTGYVPKFTTQWELVFRTFGAVAECRNGKQGGGDGERFSIAVTGGNNFDVAIGGFKQGMCYRTVYKMGVSTSLYIPIQKTKVVLNADSLSYCVNDGEYEDTFSGTLTFANQDTLYLFARSLPNNTFDGCGTENIYSHKIWENGVKIQDFVPCYRKADGVIGMYDIVNDVFYTNAGTGTFTKGADV